MIMKQIDECLTRAFHNKPRLKKKWQCIKVSPRNGEGYFQYHLYHYHHLVLVYCPFSKTILHEWWEKQADKRGLESAKEWIHAWERKQQENQV